MNLLIRRFFVNFPLSLFFFLSWPNKKIDMSNEDFLKSISLDGEIWKDVVGHEGLFVVSSFGRVISLSRIVDRKRYKFIKPPTLLTPYIDKQGYAVINLTIPPRKIIHRFVHRLVAEAFIPNPHDYPRVDHVDANPQNAHVSNLRWCTDSMNNMNPITRKRNSEARKGKTPANAKPVVRINPKDPLDIKIYPKATIDGYCQAHVCSCCRGERPLHKGYKWMWLSDYENLNISDVNVL